MRRLKGLGLAALTALFASGAQAELLELSFTDTNGESVSVDPDKKYINPDSDIRVSLSAGIDRKVRIGVYEKTGILKSQASSGLIGANDRIEVNDKRYYGDRLDVDGLENGEYVFKADIISSDGEIVQEDSYPITIDKTPPSSGNITGHSIDYGMNASGDIWNLGRGAHRGPVVKLSDIKDNLDVENVRMKITDEKGEPVYDKEVNFDRREKQSLVYVKSGVFPSSNLDEVFSVKFEIKDIAGNISSSKPQKMRFDNVVNAPSEPFGVYDPSSSNKLAPGLSGFEPYEPGMTVKTNPIRIAWRVPKENWHEHRKGGLKLVNSLGVNKRVGQDAEYVYLVNTAPYGTLNNNYWRWSNFGQWGGGSIKYNLNLSPSAPKTPVLKKIEYNYSDIGWSNFRRYYVDNSKLPVSISGVRVHVEPRSYDQSAHHRGSCVVPAGKTSCYISTSYTMKPGTTGYLHENASVFNSGRTLRSNPIWAEVNWNDKHYPKVTTQYLDDRWKLRAFITQDSRGSYFDRLKLKNSWLEDSKGNKLSASGGKVEENNTNYLYEWNLRDLAEGSYDIYVVAEEMHGPKTRVKAVSFDSDKTEPSITFNIEDGDTVSSLDDITMLVEDNFDSDAGISRINLSGGPADDDIDLSWRNRGAGKFNLEYPVMFPTMSSDESYALEVWAEDEQGNVGKETVSFQYDPPLVELVDSDGNVQLPSSHHNFTRKNGNEVLHTEPLTLSDGAVVQGSYDVFATLRSDAEVPLIVNGVRVEPGETMAILPEHNFSSREGRLSIPVSVAEDGAVGESSLLVTTVAPNAPVLLGNIESWMPDVELSASDWEIYPAVEQLDVKASLPETDSCYLTADAEEAMNESDPVSDAACFIEWDLYPEEAFQSDIDGDDAGLSINGYATEVGFEPIQYTVYVYDSDGTKVELESGSKELEVLLPEGIVDIGVEGKPDKIERLIQNLSMELKTLESGVQCDLSVSEEEAKKSTATGDPTCLVEWTYIPSGLKQAAYSRTPSLVGTIDELENNEDSLNWNLFAYTPSGTKVNMGEYSESLTLIDPKPPAISLQDDNLLEGDLYYSPMKGGYLGDYSVTARPSSMELDTRMDGEIYDSELIDFYWGDVLDVRRRLVTDSSDLWDIRNFEISARYERLPRISKEKEIQILSVPSESIRPLVEPDRNVSLNTKKLPVNVRMEDPYASEDESYSAETMGEWEIRLMNMRSYSDRVPLTEYVKADPEGKASFDIDLKDVEGKGFRLMAEARVISPVDSYERTSISPRPAYITVLRGEAIDSSIDARRIVGEAPLMMMASIELEDRQDYDALGDVTWEEREDGESEWKPVDQGTDYGSRIMRTYDSGTYDLRARVMNQHSGAEFITEAIQIQAYDIPRVKLEGPENIFVGDTAEYELEASFGGEELTEEDLYIEWSEDEGETWKKGGATYEIQKDEVTRMSVEARIRMKDGPEDHDDAWEMVKERVSFREIDGPRIGIYGPRLVEVGKEDTWRGVMDTPYRNMDVDLRGEFILPDGSTHEDEYLTYEPEPSELDSGYIYLKYRAWIDGFEDQGAESIYERRIRIWEYEWPNWIFYIRQSAHQAPADIHLRVKNPRGTARYIEGLEIEWDLPDGAEIVEDRYNDGRSLKFSEPGEYEISATITDDRDHRSVITHYMDLAEQDPWDVNFSYRASNEYKRAPLTLSFRPDVSGGHPEDRLMEFRYFKDGKMITEGERYGEVTLDEGQHVVGLQIESQFGHKVISEETVTVEPNQPPECSLRTRNMSTGWRFYASCEDPDGEIAEHRWILDGERVGIHGSRISVTNRDDKIPTVELIGIDDSGARSPTVQW